MLVVKDAGEGRSVALSLVGMMGGFKIDFSGILLRVIASS